MSSTLKTFGLAGHNFLVRDLAPGGARVESDGKVVIGNGERKF